jgi:hypoxanthine phosphoribosyltransferase
MAPITVNNKPFEVYIEEAKIQARIAELAAQMNLDLKDKKPLFLAVLNGSFLFAADLFKKLTIDCEISFVKLSSYEGTQSTEKVKKLIGLNEDIKGRTIVVLEDIVDTGITINEMMSQLMEHEPSEIKIATLLFKPAAYIKRVHLDYVGFEVPKVFLLGYGLDYDGLGRNLNDIYKIKE